MNRLPYNLAHQRSHIGLMATIVTILIRVISLLGKQNELMREVFWWLVAGREHFIFFFAKKARNECWEVVPGILGIAGKLLSLQE
jgi:hypothetical protein